MTAGKTVMVVIERVFRIVAVALLYLRWILATRLRGLPDDECSIEKSDKSSNDTVDNDTPPRDIVADNWTSELEAKSAVDHTQDDNTWAEPTMRAAEDVLPALPSEQ